LISILDLRRGKRREGKRREKNRFNQPSLEVNIDSINQRIRFNFFFHQTSISDICGKYHATSVPVGKPNPTISINLERKRSLLKIIHPNSTQLFAKMDEDDTIDNEKIECKSHAP